jgi:hypothetical protein
VGNLVTEAEVITPRQGHNGRASKDHTRTGFAVADRAGFAALTAVRWIVREVRLAAVGVVVVAVARSGFTRDRAGPHRARWGRARARWALASADTAVGELIQIGLASIASVGVAIASRRRTRQDGARAVSACRDGIDDLAGSAVRSRAAESWIVDGDADLSAKLRRHASGARRTLKAAVYCTVPGCWAPGVGGRVGAVSRRGGFVIGVRRLCRRCFGRCDIPTEDALPVLQDLVAGKQE